MSKLFITWLSPSAWWFKWGWLCSCWSAEFCAEGVDLKCLQGSVRNPPDPGLVALKDLERMGEVLVSFGLPLLHLLWSFESLAEILSNRWNSYNFPAFCSNVPPLTLSWTVTYSFTPGQAWIADAPYYQTAVHVESPHHHLLGSIPISQTCQLVTGAVALLSPLWQLAVPTCLGFSCFLKVDTCSRKGIF